MRMIDIKTKMNTYISPSVADHAVGHQIVAESCRRVAVGMWWVWRTLRMTVGEGS
jgi:hypothetical protein